MLNGPATYNAVSGRVLEPFMPVPIFLGILFYLFLV
jgi:hypothetical protein